MGDFLMADIMDILRGISQAASLNYDGSQDERQVVGDAKDAGLKRDEGDTILDARVMDGYNVRLHGKTLMLTYHSECKLKEVHNVNKFESDCEQHLANIVSYLKSEYKKITGNSLTLVEAGESDIKVEYMNNVRCWVVATKNYTVGGLEGLDEISAPSTPEERLDKTIRDFLSLGKNDKMF